VRLGAGSMVGVVERYFVNMQLGILVCEIVLYIDEFPLEIKSALGEMHSQRLTVVFCRTRDSFFPNICSLIWFETILGSG
jgi:hypothetical protein